MSSTLTLHLDDDIRARIERAAEREGKTLNNYVLQWLPEYYDREPPTRRPNAKTNGDRAANSMR